MRAPITTVDAFADRPFTGNPAGVCILAEPAPESWMQSVAAEMNLSETAFVVPQKDGYQLRWFAPAVEIDLCGHATLASAHVLWETGQLPRDAMARFHTIKSGILTAVRAGDLIELDFPSQPPTKADPPAELLPAERSVALNPRHRPTSAIRHDFAGPAQHELGSGPGAGRVQQLE